MGDAVVIWGELLWDRFPDGDQLGGAPANVAWHLAQAGGWPQLVTRIGDDELGRRALERMSELVDTDLVQVDRERATGEVTVTLEPSPGGSLEARYRLVPGRAWEHIACTPAVVAAIELAGVFVYGTLAQRTEAGLTEWHRAVNAVRGTRVCDLNLRPGASPSRAISDAIAAADVLKVNDRELASLRDWYAWSDPVARLRERARVVAVTHGAEGSTLYTESGAHEISGMSAEGAGDNVGCGDAYLAILVHGLTSGWDLVASGRAASRYAAAVAGCRGATPVFEPDRVADLLEVA